MNKKDLDFQPVNINERLLYGCLIRLDALCEMVSSLLSYIAEKNDVAITNINVEEKLLPKKKSTKKSTQATTKKDNNDKDVL